MYILDSSSVQVALRGAQVVLKQAVSSFVLLGDGRLDVLEALLELGLAHL